MQSIEQQCITNINDEARSDRKRKYIYNQIRAREKIRRSTGELAIEKLGNERCRTANFIVDSSVVANVTFCVYISKWH